MKSSSLVVSSSRRLPKSALPILGAVVLASALVSQMQLKVLLKWGVAPTVISVALDAAQLASRAVQMAAPVVVLVALTANFSGTY